MAAPTRAELAQHVELLQENLGQPGFRELLVTVHDLDAWRDLVFALLGQAHRGRFFSRTLAVSGVRHFEAFDLGGVARDHLGDALVAAPFGAARDRTTTRFSVEGPWRGETHRSAIDRMRSLA